MLTSPIATFINHDLHNKFAILRNATGMIEMDSANYPESNRENLEKQTRLLNQTIDRLSASVINITNCLNLEIQDDNREPISINYLLEKSANYRIPESEIKLETEFGQLKMHEEKFLFIMEAVIELVGNLSPGSLLHFEKGADNELVITFPDTPGDKSELKNIRELLIGKLKPEALPHHFNIFFANYLLKKRDGRIEIEFIEPGIMGIKIGFGSF
ncbi:MAG: hypothetical protein ACXWV4_09630 [Flavitalea sp.]